MKKDIAEDPRFAGYLEKGRYFDFETPYGYGGPLTDHPVPADVQERFLCELQEYAEAEGWVSQFVRFHPLLGNQNAMSDVFEIRYLHDTVYMDTESPEIIMTNMDSKNRNMVRKAVKNGITIVQRPIIDYYDFIPIYETTMKRAQAADYYFFDEEYFKAQAELKNNSCILYAMKEGKPVAAAILYYNDRYMHYHLAGTLTEFRQFAPGNLLLYEAALLACKKGIHSFHLGGGMTQDDKLFGFKKQFNKNGRLPFYIGRTIFSKDVYKELMEVREKSDPGFNVGNTRMIQYRA